MCFLLIFLVNLGWPKLPWLIVENLNKSFPKDWSPPNRIPPDTVAYIEVIIQIKYKFF